MSTKNIYQTFQQLNKSNNITCTEQELEEFVISGLLFQVGDSYITRDNKPVNLSLIKPVSYKFNLNFGNLLSEANKYNYKKIYFMSERCYNKYKEEGLIIKQGQQEFFRLFDKELWLVVKI